MMHNQRTTRKRLLVRLLTGIALLLLQQQPSSAFILGGKVKRRAKQNSRSSKNDGKISRSNKSESSSSSSIIAAGKETSPNIQIRLARVSDVAALQRCNRACLPENYQDQYFLDHLKYSPKLIMVAERVFPDCMEKAPEVVAYVLGRVEEKPYTHRVPAPYFDKLQCQALQKYHAGIGRCPTEKFGHVASLAVMKEYQRRGLASSLLQQFHYNLETCYDHVATSGLHVRVSNVGATKLYERLDYSVAEVMKSYYTDGEDAYFMKKLMPVAIESVGFERTSSIRGHKDEIMDNNDREEEFRLPRRLIQPEDKQQRADSSLMTTTTKTSKSTTTVELVNGNTQTFIEAEIIRPQNVEVISRNR